MRKFHPSWNKMLVASLLLLLPLNSSHADELTAAQNKVKELQNSLILDKNYLEVDVPRLSSQLNECIQRNTNAQEPIEQEKYASCVLELSKLEINRDSRIENIATIMNEIARLESEITRLRQSSTTPVPSSPTSSTTGGSVQSPSGTTSTPGGISDKSPQTSTSPVPAVSNGQNSRIPLAGATPAVSVSPTPLISPKTQISPSPINDQKITPSPKPVVKKKTITCVKGKTVRKVTAIKPLCPRGFKIRR
jgi:hypothetical protein